METSKGLRTQLVHLPPVAAQLIHRKLSLYGQRLVKLVRHASFHPAVQEFVETLYPPYMLIFSQTLSTRGPQGKSCWISTAGERLRAPRGLTDKESWLFPCQLSWANRYLE